ncbi:MAG: aldehyde dehydrogenase family protein [Planctomycetes bacterium]|nr:aldehyde dehydrogenase family protein [Planctomycetota bacterium]
MRRELLRIGGALRAGARLEAVTSPWSGEQVGEVAVGGPADVDDAVAAAARAFEETRRLPTHRRAAVLEGAARAVEAGADDLARLMALESGKPITQCKAEVARGVITLSLGAVEARRLGGEVLPVDLEPRGEGRLCLATRVPRGPVAAISPFNFPLNLVAHKLSPAVAVGASVVLKPPPQCPLTAFALAALLDEAGLPPGALNVVHCPPDAAQRMVEDPRMKVVSFTGSDAVGWRLKAVAGKKQVLLELGGNAPCVVDEDADLERALPAIVAASFQNGGQVCIRIQRLFVHRARFDEVLGRFVEAARALPVGDPLDPRTVVGPLIEPRHVERVLAWVREAKDGGATVHCGGEAAGQAVLPTVLTGAPRDARVCRDEVFGPVTVVEPFDTFDEALARCNDTRFGLQAAVFTRDLGKALRAHRELDYGGVIVNDAPTFRIDNFPYGGTKDSGFGREGVRYAMEEMTEAKVLVLG